jgi:hypothetical protein
MTEKDTKNADPNDPRNQVARQTATEDAGPGEPGHYSPPDPNLGVTKSPPNEVLTEEMIKKAEEIPDNRSDWDKKHAGEAKGGKKAGTDVDPENYEELTVPELKELAHQRGVEIHSDMLKDDIIKALKKS